MRARGVGLLVAALLLAGCGGSSLESDDPAGYKACQRYAEAAKVEDDPLMRVGGLLEASDYAGDSTTEAIRAAVEKVGADDWLADPEKLAAACEANGVEIP